MREQQGSIGMGTSKETHVDTGRVKRTRQDLEAQLDKQLNLLQTYCQLYDQGDKNQANMIAVIIRTLVYDGPKNSKTRALLAQLGIRHKFLDTAFDVTNDGMEVVWRCRLAATDARVPGAWAPLLDSSESRMTNFFEWWRETVIKDFDGNVFSRKDVILNVADTDGGAHVDPSLERTYAKLTRENSCQMLFGNIDMSHGWPETLAGHKMSPMESPVNASIRQIGHEVLKTLVPGYHYQTDAYAPSIQAIGVVVTPQEGTSPGS
jgi:hypothetical protein